MDTAGGLASGDPKGRTVEEQQTKRDELLDRIERDRLVAEWCWPHLTETLSRLADLGDHMTWLQIAYLSHVVVHGTAVFAHVDPVQGSFLEDRWPPVDCRCGQRVPGARPQRRGGRDIVTVVCPSCGLDLVVYDDEPYQGPTLIT